jgi:lytic murein transglycosylase
MALGFAFSAPCPQVRLRRMRIAIAALAPLICVFGLIFAPAVASADGSSAYRAALEQRFQQWIAARWPEAQAQGVSRASFDAQTKGLTIDWSLPLLVLPDPAFPGGPALPSSMKPKAPARQPEFDSPARYFKPGNLDTLAAQGKAVFSKWGKVLAEVQRRYDVPASIVVAIWGRETGFGQADIPFDALSAIATQGFLGMRPDKYAHEFVAALKILQQGHVSRGQMKSSWAGAMGATQFLPSDYLDFAVDFDADGKADIWNSVPDALASTANSLHHKGWIGSETWGYEVTLPKGFDCALQGPDRMRSFADWQKLGVERVKNRPFPPGSAATQGFLVLPAGMEGPAFLATRNFGVLKRYNNSDVYALFVGHLADMIASGAPADFVGPWLPVDRFPRSQMLDFQNRLVGLGHDVGKVDGLVGFKTRQAIGLYEKKIGAPLTCYPSKSLVTRVLSGH